MTTTLSNSKPRYLRRLSIVVAAALLAVPTATARVAEESGIGEPTSENLIQARESGIVIPGPRHENFVQARESGVTPVGDGVVLVSNDRFDWVDAGVGSAATTALLLALALGTLAARTRLSRPSRELPAA